MQLFCTVGDSDPANDVICKIVQNVVYLGDCVKILNEDTNDRSFLLFVFCHIDYHVLLQHVSLPQEILRLRINGGCKDRKQRLLLSLQAFSLKIVLQMKRKYQFFF